MEDPLCPKCKHPASKHNNGDPFMGHCRVSKSFKAKKTCGCSMTVEDINGEELTMNERLERYGYSEPKDK
jgi:hypothetical protein